MGQSVEHAHCAVIACDAVNVSWIVSVAEAGSSRRTCLTLSSATDMSQRQYSLYRSDWDAVDLARVGGLRSTSRVGAVMVMAADVERGPMAIG